jgi:hypothetical protein
VSLVSPPTLRTARAADTPTAHEVTAAPDSASGIPFVPVGAFNCPLGAPPFIGSVRTVATIEAIGRTLHEREAEFVDGATAPSRWRLHEVPGTCFVLPPAAGFVPHDGIRVELTVKGPDCELKFVGCRELTVTAVKLAPP